MTAKNLAIYKASAGAGKTFTLVKEYLKLALSSTNADYFKSILAITFTNKAATEMKYRVFEHLNEIAVNGVSSQMANLLLQELSITPEELTKRAENSLKSMLYNYSEIAISTIDSFVIKILRSFTKELDLPSKFEIEIEQDEVLDLALEQLIDKSLSDKKIRQALLDYIKFRIDDGKKWDFFDDLKQFSRELFSDKSRPFLKNLAELKTADFFKVSSQINAQIQADETVIRNSNKKLIEEIRIAGFEADDFAGGSRSFVQKFFKFSNDGDYNKLILSDKQNETVEGDVWFAKAKDELITKSLAHLGIWRKLIFEIVERNKSRKGLKAIASGIFSLMLLNEISQLVNEIKKEENSILISDNHKLINDVVQNNPIPFIYERIGERYHHLMIDEFQDTSVTQFQNTIPLIENNLAYHKFNLIVGDTKQSIYRFNNGVFEQLALLPENIYRKERLLDGDYRESMFKTNGESIYLNYNYRSLNEIIHFNNTIFSFLVPYLSQNANLLGAYDSFVQEFGKNKNGGLVELCPLDKENYRELCLDKLITQIKECLYDGFQLSEIAVLVRGKSDGSKVAIALSQYPELPYISNDSLRLEIHQDIQLLVNMMIQFRDRDDLNSGISILSYLISKNDKIEFHAQLKKHGYSSAGTKKLDRFDLEGCLNDFQMHFEWSHGQLSLIETAYEICALFQIQLNNSFVQQFLDEVQGYGVKNGRNISGFLNYWDDVLYKKGINIPESKNAIRIITIHKSKGLEYPVVFMPFNNYNKGAKGDKLWVKNTEGKIELPCFLISENSELADTIFADSYSTEQNYKLIDNLNLFYVALTRAKERLYLYFPEIKNPKLNRSNIKNPELWLNLFLKEQNDSSYRLGERTRKQDKSPDENGVQKEYFFSSKEWKKKLAVDKKSYDNYYHYSGIQDKKLEGIIVHKIFESSEDLDDCLNEIHKLEVLNKIDEAQKIMLTEKFKSIYSNSEIASVLLRQGTVENEISIVDSKGNIYRPDRLIIAQDQLDIIDFKTGEMKDNHREQIDQYAEIMQEIGFTNIKKSLIYFNDEILISWN